MKDLIFIMFAVLLVCLAIRFGDDVIVPNIDKQFKTSRTREELLAQSAKNNSQAVEALLKYCKTLDYQISVLTELQRQTK